jgi:LmbE family N-acetylglucosaminyl deacetylase
LIRRQIDATLIALSPHLDDVVLSAAATVLRWPGRRLLVSVFSGDPAEPPSGVAAAFHSACNLGHDAMLRRRLEDFAACEVLRCEPLHLEFREALYRTAANGESEIGEEGELFVASAARQDDAVRMVAETLRRILDEHPFSTVLAPLGHGCHRDHIIVRQAIEHLCYPIFAYYDDQPYEWWGRPRGPRPPDGYVHKMRKLHADGWETKIRALGCYASQMRMLWGQDWKQGFEIDHRQAGGIREEGLWVRV